MQSKLPIDAQNMRCCGIYIYKPFIMIIACAVLIARDCAAWTSELYPCSNTGCDRSNAMRDSLAFRLGDFSWAGYYAGEKIIPAIAPAIVIKPIDKDNSQQINAAIQKLAKRKIGPDGFRGRILLVPGTFEISKEIRVYHSGIVLSGSGPDSTFMYVNESDFARKKAISFNGPSSADWLNYPEGDCRRNFKQDAPDGARCVVVDNVKGLGAGDAVIIRQFPSVEWSKSHGANGSNLWPAGNDLTAPRFCRIIQEIRSDTLFFEEPLRYPLQVQYGAHVFKGAFLEHVGIENLSIGFKKGSDTENGGATHRSTAVAMNDCMNGWIRNVRSYRRDSASVHLQSYGFTLRACKWITIENCHLQDPQNKNVGGNGYLFNPVVCDDVLFRNCVARNGRHNFTLHYCCSGVVITGCTSTNSRSDQHQYLAIENLFDNFTIEGDSVTAGNRGDKSQGSWWCSAKATFWNIKGSGALYLNSYFRGYLIGVSPTIRMGVGPENILQDYGLTYLPEKQWVERGGAGEILQPVSLYESQLEHRLRAKKTVSVRKGVMP